MQNRPMNPETIADPIGHYSHAVEVRAGARTLHLAGQTGVKPDGSVPAGAEAQAEAAWQNIVAILTHANMGIRDIVKVTHYLTDKADIPAYNKVRSKFLADHKPASTLLVIAGLARPDFVVEVDVVAAQAG